MVTRLMCVLFFLSLFLVPVSQAAAQAGPQDLVEEYLTAIGARNYTITAIDDDYVIRRFPRIAFFSVRFRQFPVAFLPPEGLASSNVFAVTGDDISSVFPFTAPNELEALFFKALPAVKNEEEVQDSGWTWLRLTQEFRQDGFYTFAPPNTTFLISTEEGSLFFGEVVVTGGGRGRIRALLVFDANGVLFELIEFGRVVEGPRPICQATKLLDPDPIVRKMAEQALLYMGRPAKEYLDEQRAKASPELKEAIDRIWKRILEQEK